MGASTLSKLQMEQYEEIVKLFADKRSINLNDVDAVRMAKRSLSYATSDISER